MTKLLCVLLALLFSLGGPVRGANIDFGRSSLAAEKTAARAVTRGGESSAAAAGRQSQ
jgi:hypothetical protein